MILHFLRHGLLFLACLSQFLFECLDLLPLLAHRSYVNCFTLSIDDLALLPLGRRSLHIPVDCVWLLLDESVNRHIAIKYIHHLPKNGTIILLKIIRSQELGPERLLCAFLAHAELLEYLLVPRGALSLCSAHGGHNFHLLIELDHLVACGRCLLLPLLFPYKVVSLGARLADHDVDNVVHLGRHSDHALLALGLDVVDEFFEIAHDLVLVGLKLLEALVDGVEA